MKPKFNTEIVKDFIKEKGLTVKQFCKLYEIPYYRFNQFMKSDFNITVPPLIKMADVLNVNLIDLLGF